MPSEVVSRKRRPRKPRPVAPAPAADPLAGLLDAPTSEADARAVAWLRRLLGEGEPATPSERRPREAS